MIGRDRDGDVALGEADEELARWVEDDLRRVADQHHAARRAVAEADAHEVRCLEAVMPVSAQVAERFRRVERTSRQICSSRHHEVVVRLRQPSNACVSVTLRWGAKFGLTDGERQLMRSYQRRPRRLWRYPEVVVGHDYHELSAVLDAAAQTVCLGSGPCHPLAHLLAAPAVVDDYLATGLAHPTLVRSEHRRSEGYRQRTG